MENNVQDQPFRPVFVIVLTTIALLSLVLCVLLLRHHKQDTTDDQSVATTQSVSQDTLSNAAPAVVTQSASPVPESVSATDLALAQFGLSTKTLVGIHMAGHPVPPMRISGNSNH